jgi:hypothetical protein
MGRLKGVLLDSILGNLREIRQQATLILDRCQDFCAPGLESGSSRSGI